MPGDTVEVVTYVGVRRTSGPGTPATEHDTSTAGFDWTAPAGDTAWASETLDSSDPAGPDDPDLHFTAVLKYRSVEE